MSLQAPTTLPAVEGHYEVVIVGGGQAGLSMSYFLQQARIGHIVFEKHFVTHAWRTQRWDAFSLVTPNWQCALPGHPYEGKDPHGFMKKDEIIEYLDGFVAAVNAPVREGVTVQLVRPRAEGGYRVVTTAGELSAGQVVIASGGYHAPIIPRMAERLPEDVVQVHSAQYRNPQSLPEGAVLVVGSGQSGAQIAEDLHLAGKRVYLATGDAPRCARFYRGKDVVDWLADMGYYEMSVDEHPLREGVRDNTNHYVTGRDGGRDIDLRQFALDGMELFGRMTGLDGSVLEFAGDLKANLDHADNIYNSINAAIDKYIEKTGIEAQPGTNYLPVWEPQEERLTLDLRQAGITSIVWCIGFLPDFGWIDAPVFNGRGTPVHKRGVTGQEGLYFLGLPWLHTWGSGRFSGVARDAQYLSEQIVALAAGKEPVRLRA
jgi:putative flavoprotein involved in K+ transport